MHIVDVKGAKKIFGEGDVAVHALRGVNFTAETGEFAALAGPSGSGKTTLLNIIGGLDQPTEGRIEIAGTDLADLSRKALADLRLHNISFVFQEFNLIPVLTARENIEFVLCLQGVGSAEQKERIDPLLDALGIEELADRRPGNMSGGQRQRVAVARAIAAKPAIVLADEPTASLDTETANTLLDLMEQLNQEHGTTFFFSTHDPRVMERARRLVRIQDGQIAEDTRSAPES
ncbi:MAG: ABC transporter ATP-binding protein [Candidatus Latescibacteria bacterium]|nr:ABC transporter ATP-binding protein [Candidatus Latescibacterota bacterium]